MLRFRDIEWQCSNEDCLLNFTTRQEMFKEKQIRSERCPECRTKARIMLIGASFDGSNEELSEEAIDSILKEIDSDESIIDILDEDDL